MRENIKEYYAERIVSEEGCCSPAVAFAPEFEVPSYGCGDPTVHAELRPGETVLDLGSVDAVISNCVINLSTDKPRVYREAFRVLKPGGRLLVSDILRRGERLTAASAEGWCSCIDGADSPEAVREHLAGAGFADIAIDPPPEGARDGETYSGLIRARRPHDPPAG